MKLISHHLLIGLAMLAGAGLTLALTPRLKMADQGLKINLEVMIPKQIRDWQLDNTITPIYRPDIQANLNRIYNQVLNRTYINSKGEQIMLNIAYGGDQTNAMQVHQPEGCYVSQGFQIGSTSKDAIETGEAKFPVMKFVATQSPRVEPITYWIIIGDTAVPIGLKRNLARLKYGLSGKVPYGIIIRVSTISTNESQSYRAEEQFVRDMLGAMPMKYRKILTGAET